MKKWLIRPRLALEICAGAAAVVLACATLPSCGADGTGLVPDCSLGGCGVPDASLDGIGGQSGSDASAGSDSADIGSRRSPLCAMTGCFPGFAQACISALPVDGGGDEVPNLALDPEEGGDSQDEIADGTIVPVVDGGTVIPDDAAVVVIGPGDGAIPPIETLPDAHPVATESGATDAAGVTEGTVSEAGNSAQSCYVSPATTGVIASCSLAGAGIAGSACADSHDCSVSLACVQIDGIGVCRPFSCGLPPSCTAGSFYQLAPLIVGGAALTATVVPVCTPNMPCDLLATMSGCNAGKACAVVGNDGETSCVTPGPAKRNEYCDESTPCGDGLVCAMMTDKTQNKCLQLCHVDQSAVECPGGTCQGGSKAIPSGFGICVGDDPDAG